MHIRHYFFTIILAYIFSGVLLSLLPAFYPLEAERKGALPSQYGFVFAIPGLSVFVFSPIFAKYIPKLGAKLCLCFGYLLASFSGILFGFLPYIQEATIFIFLSLVLRFLEGLGASMYVPSAFGLLMTIFPNKVYCTIKWIDTM